MQENTGLSEQRLVCRFCLAIGGNFQPIHKHKTIDIPAIVKLLTNLVISENDAFSKHICSKCIDTVECIVKFRAKCIASVHEAEHKLLLKEEPSFLKEVPDAGTLQVEFIKCESAGITDCEEYEQEEPFSNLSESEQDDHEGLIQRRNESGRAGNKQIPPVIEAAENETLKLLENDSASSNKSTVLLNYTLRDEVQEPTPEKNSEKFDEQKGKNRSQLRNRKANNKTIKNDRIKIQSYECEVCGKTLKSKSNYSNHRKMHNRKGTNAPQKSEPEKDATDEQKKIFLCNICGHNFCSSSNLVVHLRRHNGQSVCECTVCGKGFPRRSDLVMHMRKHTGEKPFICPTCKRGFSRLDKLHIHIRTHTGEKPYECPCGRAYAQKNDLKNHQKRNICGQNFDVEKLSLPRTTSICIKSPKRSQPESTTSSQPQIVELERNLSTIPMAYSTTGDSASAELVSDPMVGMAYQSGWNNYLSTPNHSQQSERRDAVENHTVSNPYMQHQSKLIT